MKRLADTKRIFRLLFVLFKVYSHPRRDGSFCCDVGVSWTRRGCGKVSADGVSERKEEIERAPGARLTDSFWRSRRARSSPHEWEPVNLSCRTRLSKHQRDILRPLSGKLGHPGKRILANTQPTSRARALRSKQHFITALHSIPLTAQPSDGIQSASGHF